MNFNWGTGIAIFSACFMLMILGFVVNSFQHRTELVADDYYQQELQYQNRIEEQNNARAIGGEVKLSYQKGQLELLYPSTNWEGDIAFFRPSNSQMDFTLPITMDSNQLQLISGERLASGLWRLRFSWQLNGQAYYTEQSLVIP